MSTEAVNLVRFHDFTATPARPGRRGSGALIKGAVMLELAWRWFDTPIPAPLRELAARLNVNTEHVRRALDALEADGYLAREHANGGRSVAWFTIDLARLGRAVCTPQARNAARPGRALRAPSISKFSKADGRASTPRRPGRSVPGEVETRGDQSFLPGTGWVTEYRSLAALSWEDCYTEEGDP